MGEADSSKRDKAPVTDSKGGRDDSRHSRPSEHGMLEGGFSSACAQEKGMPWRDSRPSRGGLDEANG